MKKVNEKEKIVITKEKCLSSWNTPIFINYPFKDFLSYIKKQFVIKNNDLLLLLRLYKEICIMQRDDTQKGLNIFLSDESIEKITTEEISYLLENIKRLLYLMLDEIKQKNNNGNKYIYNSITDENQLLAYIKKNFSIFISLFKNGGLNDKNKTKNEKELDEKFMKMFGLNNNISNYLDNINKNNQKVDEKMDIEEDETNKNNNSINNIDYSNEIKIEIINIYNVILSTYNDLERPGEDIISFSQILVKNFVSNLDKEQNDFIIKVKKSLSLLIGLYKNIFKSEKIINHPIRAIYKEVLNYIIKAILYNEVKDDSKKEIDNYYQYLLSIYNVLSKDKKESCLTDIQDSILCNSKQLIYENVDSTEFKNPLDLKKNNGLNDIDNRILFHPYLINILSFLDEEYAKAFLGFYIRFFVASEKNELFCCKENIIKCLNYFIKIKWLPEDYVELVTIIENKNTTFDKIKKIIEFVFLYLRTYKLAPENSSKDIESKKKACEKLKYLYKNIILENINVLE